MPLVPMKPVLDKALAGGYAVGAFKWNESGDRAPRHTQRLHLGHVRRLETGRGGKRPHQPGGGRPLQTPRDFGLLKKIRDQAAIPLVLHGGSGISDDDFRRAIGLGIAKINFYTGMSQAALAAVSEKAGSLGRAYHDFPLLMSQIKKRVAETVAAQIGVFGSAGKA